MVHVSLMIESMTDPMEEAALGIPVEIEVNFLGVAVKTTNNTPDPRMRHGNARTREMTTDHDVIVGREAAATTAETVAIGEGERVGIETTVVGEIAETGMTIAGETAETEMTIAGETAEIGMIVMLAIARVLEIVSGALNHLAQVARKIMK